MIDLHIIRREFPMFDGIYAFVIKPALEQYSSRIFEDVCREYLRIRNRQNALPFRLTNIGRWWNKSDELDIMATDQNRSSFLAGECKCKRAAFDLSELNAALFKFITAKVYDTLFSKNGFTNAVQTTAIDQDVQLVTLDDFFHVSYYT